MKNSKELLRDLQQQITIKEDASEIRSMMFLVFEHVLGLTQSEVIAEKPVLLDEKLAQKLNTIVARINQHEPIQYILGNTYFFGRKFKVNPFVLIPRPETELLIEEALKEINPHTSGTIIDIGTGSGCIAITLAKELPEKRILAIDVSEGALKLAKENAFELNAQVQFHLLNVMTDKFPESNLEMIVSNPPYIAIAEKGEMNKNVLDFEPHLALFVPNDDPLVFYKKIAEKGFPALNDYGKVVVEINERFGKEVAEVFKRAGFYRTKIVKDLQQKDRIVIAFKS